MVVVEALVAAAAMWVLMVMQEVKEVEAGMVVAMAVVENMVGLVVELVEEMVAEAAMLVALAVNMLEDMEVEEVKVPVGGMPMEGDMPVVAVVEGEVEEVVVVPVVAGHIVVDMEEVKEEVVGVGLAAVENMVVHTVVGLDMVEEVVVAMLEVVAMVEELQGVVMEAEEVPEVVELEELMVEHMVVVKEVEPVAEGAMLPGVNMQVDMEEDPVVAMVVVTLLKTTQILFSNYKFLFLLVFMDIISNMSCYYY